MPPKLSLQTNVVSRLTFDSRCAQQCIDACEGNPARHMLALLAIQLLAHVSPRVELPEDVVKQLDASVGSVCLKSEDLGLRCAMLRTQLCKNHL